MAFILPLLWSPIQQGQFLPVLLKEACKSRIYTRLKLTHPPTLRLRKVARDIGASKKVCGLWPKSLKLGRFSGEEKQAKCLLPPIHHISRSTIFQASDFRQHKNLWWFLVNSGQYLWKHDLVFCQVLIKRSSILNVRPSITEADSFQDLILGSVFNV